jgi:hypothetical protein
VTCNCVSRKIDCLDDDDNRAAHCGRISPSRSRRHLEHAA